MLSWDETDVITVLEVMPEEEADGIWHKYTVKRLGIELVVTIYQYDGDVLIELKSEAAEKPLFSMRIVDCPAVVRKLDSTGEYLEFAASKCFGSRYDGTQSIPYGVRVYVKPSISVSLFG